MGIFTKRTLLKIDVFHRCVYGSLTTVKSILVTRNECKLFANWRREMSPKYSHLHTYIHTVHINLYNYIQCVYVYVSFNISVSVRMNECLCAFVFVCIPVYIYM